MRAFLARRPWIIAPLAALMLFIPAAVPLAADAPRPIIINAKPITAFDNRDTSQRRFGVLEFRGGLELTSGDKEFGGLSGLHVAADGAHFITISDKGRWFRGRIVYRGGAPAGIADAETAPMLGPDGQPLAARGWFDTEAMAVANGIIYVGIERVDEIVRFDYGKDGLAARGQPIKVPPEIKKLPFNKSIEAMAMVPAGQPLAGTLLVISERGLDAAGNILGFLIGGPSPGTFTVKRSRDYDISDMTMLPDGDFLLLERHYSRVRGVAMRMRRIAKATVRPGAVLDGPVLIEADLAQQIDNMEGIAAHRNAQGEIILTVVSDDNFSVVQRTILLQFALLE